MRQKLSIIVPPLVLIIIGLAVYITVVKMVTPDTKVITAMPEESQASQAAATPTPANPITLNVQQPTEAEIAAAQAEADSGQADWRFDALESARRQAGSYGFIPGDELTLTLEAEEVAPEKTASIIAMHADEAYIITMSQPGIVGSKGVWFISAIEKR